MPDPVPMNSAAWWEAHVILGCNVGPDMLRTVRVGQFGCNDEGRVGAAPAAPAQCGSHVIPGDMQDCSKELIAPVQVQGLCAIMPRFGGEGFAVPISLEPDSSPAASSTHASNLKTIDAVSAQDQPGALTKFLHAVDWSHVEERPLVVAVPLWGDTVGFGVASRSGIMPSSSWA